MFNQTLSIFINVVTPVFTIVLLGYLVGPRLQLQYRTLSRTAYYILIPAFIFNVMSGINIDLHTAGRMILTISAVYLITGFIGWLAATLLGYGRNMAIAFLMTGVFGNMGNFGLAIVNFHLGDQAMESATVYMVTINTVAFAVCVMAASWLRNGGFGALKTLLMTPGFVILPFALFFPVTGLTPPLMVSRVAGLLGNAMIPLMLLILGLQLRETGHLSFGMPVLVASAVRLVVGPILAFVLISISGLSGYEAASGILQASMPAAVITSIIATEHDIVPNFVTSVVFLTTLLSLFSLTLVMAFL